jgi:DNA-binding MarR family transcriptional regulator
MGVPMPLEEQLSFALSVATRNVTAIHRPFLAALGLTYPQYLAMLALWHHGSVSVRGLGELLQLDSGTLSPLLKRLEALGYVHRERAPADERSVIVTATAAGEALRARAASIPAAVRDQLGMPAEEVEHLLAILAGVMAAGRSPALRPRSGSRRTPPALHRAPRRTRVAVPLPQDPVDDPGASQ